MDYRNIELERRKKTVILTVYGDETRVSTMMCSPEYNINPYTNRSFELRLMPTTVFSIRGDTESTCVIGTKMRQIYEGLIDEEIETMPDRKVETILWPIGKVWMRSRIDAYRCLSETETERTTAVTNVLAFQGNMIGRIQDSMRRDINNTHISLVSNRWSSESGQMQSDPYVTCMFQYEGGPDILPVIDSTTVRHLIENAGSVFTRDEEIRHLNTGAFNRILRKRVKELEKEEEGC